jgi:type I restriction-modification system DNA methylase subunit
LSDQQITLSQLEGHLWESANILRGPVDAADLKTYIFPLLFFKRICDVWDGEYQEIVDETGDKQLALTQTPACLPRRKRGLVVSWAKLTKRFRKT